MKYIDPITLVLVAFFIVAVLLDSNRHSHYKYILNQQGTVISTENKVITLTRKLPWEIDKETAKALKYFKRRNYSVIIYGDSGRH